MRERHPDKAHPHQENELRAAFPALMRGMLGARLWLGLLSIVLAIYASLLFAESDLLGSGCCGSTWPTPNPIQAERLAVNGDPKELDASIQRRTAILLLRSRPAAAEAWLRLAYADTLQYGRVTPEANLAFYNSYLLLPYAGGDTPLRLIFALDVWDQLDGRVRAAVLDEYKIMDKDDRVRGLTRSAGRRIQNPAGRMAAVLLGLEPSWTWSQDGTPAPQ